MKTFIALAVFALAISVDASADFKTCNGFDNSPFVKPFHLTIKPDPLVAKEGETVSIHFDATIVTALPAGSKVHVLLEDETVPIPCAFKLPGVPVKLGSCTYDAQELLDFIPADECSKFAPAGQKCKLPLGPGFYGDKDPNGAAVITLPKIPDIVTNLLSGEVDITIKATDNSGKEILCIHNTLTVKA